MGPCHTLNVKTSRFGSLASSTIGVNLKDPQDPQELNFLHHNTVTVANFALRLFH